MNSDKGIKFSEWLKKLSDDQIEEYYLYYRVMKSECKEVLMDKNSTKEQLEIAGNRLESSRNILMWLELERSSRKSFEGPEKQIDGKVWFYMRKKIRKALMDEALRKGACFDRNGRSVPELEVRI